MHFSQLTFQHIQTGYLLRDQHFILRVKQYGNKVQFTANAELVTQLVNDTNFDNQF